MAEKKYVSDNAQLMDEWNWDNNGTLSPSDTALGSHKKVWWRCQKGHEWQAIIKDRARGNGCPYCSGRYPIRGVNDLQTVNPFLAREWNFEKNNGLTPMDISHYSDKKVWWKCNNGHEWESTVSNRTIGRGCPYCAGKKTLQGYNDLKTISPRIAQEWNYEKNGILKPENFTVHSNKKVWWKCSRGHEWQATINDRSSGTGCPVCSSERRTSFPEYALIFYLSKYGIDAVHTHKENGYELDVYIPARKVAIEYDGYYWHKNRAEKDLEKNQKCNNDGILLYRIREKLPALGSCSKDYIVQDDHADLSLVLRDVLSEIIGMRVEVNLEKDSIEIENLRERTEKDKSLLFTNPRIASEWNYIKNGKIRPEHLTANSHKKVWWKCSKGHDWLATIDNRNNGNGCPYCSGRDVLAGDNDLQTVNPMLAGEWHYEKNNRLTPKDVTTHSNKKVWWKCHMGHEWQATVNDRSTGTGCPYCLGRYVIKGENDLQTVNPALANEWNYEKNKDFAPTDVLPYSNKKVWWKCSKGHEWQSTINHRSNGNGCPYCAGQRLLKGQNDLQTLNPLLAKEWHFEKNDGLTPADVMPHSNRKVWWKCSNGHEWQATINNRSNGRNCYQCTKEKRKNVLKNEDLI